MIFPGMDPYLEHPQLWSGVHSSLIVYFRDQLQPLLLPRYVASIEEQVYVEGSDRDVIPDLRVERTSVESAAPRRAASLVLDEPIVVEVPIVQIRERYIEILDRQSNLSVVTVIEVVGPSNKIAGPGRDSYLQKQHETLSSATHLVEIDLLRKGKRALAVPESRARLEGEFDYLISVNRADEPRTRFELYLRKLREPLGSIRIPLADGDPDVKLNLQNAIDRAWESGGYPLRVNYAAPCIPSLSPADEAWVDQLVHVALPKNVLE